MTTLSKCCVSGHLHKGEPQGKIQKYAGLDTYITGSNTTKSIVIITVSLRYAFLSNGSDRTMTYGLIQDIFGFDLPVCRDGEYEISFGR